MLTVIENLFTAEEAAQLRAQLVEQPWLDGIATAGGQAASVKANLQMDDRNPVAQQLRQQVLERLGRNPLFVSAALPQKIYPPKFNCYRDGGHYGLHVDSAIMQLPNGESLRTDLSITLFLSEPETYDGGELMIETRYGAQAVKLNAGSAVLYPSSSLHQVTPTTGGERICSFFWIQSLVADDHQREQLFELDQCIQALTMDRGHQDPQVKSLTGIYHNLLRGWATT
ncbi:Fe2+-dependent dioxygenase [Microbulbifer sp. SA54]|uniref:Fe2+-dependent dioxygenase n=1 Tax=Microbulbifer sp. SA54 TaxID=3401577 RepID=UPI003AAB5DF8